MGEWSWPRLGAGPDCLPPRPHRGREWARSTWLRSSISTRGGQPVCRVPVAYLRHAPTGGEHEAVRSRPRRAQSWDSTTPAGGSCRSRAASWPCPTSRRVGGEAADLAVAQAVVDEREEMTRRGDAPDVAAPPGADPGFHRGDLRVAHGTRDGLDGGPAQQPAALLGDVPAMAVAVGLAQPGCQPGPRAQPSRVVERLTSPISATNTAAKTGPTRLDLNET